MRLHPHTLPNGMVIEFIEIPCPLKDKRKPMIQRFMTWTDEVCDRYIPKGEWNMLLQVGIVVVWLSLALYLRGI